MEHTMRKINSHEHTPEYWMLDYHFNDGSPTWMRHPFLTWDQVVYRLWNLQMLRRPNNIKKFTSQGHLPTVDWSSLRIQKESDLDAMVDENGDVEDLFPDDENYKFSPVCTMREFLFDDRYQKVADFVRSGVMKPEMLNTHQSTTGELVDPQHFIESLKEDYPDGIDWDEYDADQNQQIAA